MAVVTWTRSWIGTPASPGVLGVLVIATACGAPGVSVRHYADLNRAIEAGNHDAALARLHQSRELYGEKSSVLYLMDTAMIETLAGRPADANAHIQAAEDLIESLYTKSVTREAASFLTSDASLPYEGEDFEKVFLNVLAALNHARMGEPDEAAVEARKADVRLAETARTRGKDTAYGEDAFVRFLMGLMYEDAGEANDAWVSYARAIQAYQAQENRFGVPVPRALARRAAIVAASLGFHDEVASLREAFPGAVPDDPLEWAGMGRVVVVEFAGEVPVKVERRIEVTVGQGMVFLQTMDVTSREEQQVSSAISAAKAVAGTANVAIAYPVMVGRSPASLPVEVTVAGPEGGPGRTVVAEPVHNLAAIAPVCLEERMGRIWARTVARAVVKFLLATAAQKAGEAAGGKKYGWITGLLAGATTSAALQASEHADTRSWGTLPAEVRTAVIEVPPGEHEVRVRGARASPGRVLVDEGRSAWWIVRTR